MFSEALTFKVRVEANSEDINTIRGPASRRDGNLLEIDHCRRSLRSLWIFSLLFLSWLRESVALLSVVIFDSILDYLECAATYISDFGHIASQTKSQE